MGRLINELDQTIWFKEFISPIKLITKNCFPVFCMQFNVALETVNSICFQKVNIQLFFNRTHFNYLCTIDIGFPEKKKLQLFKRNRSRTIQNILIQTAILNTFLIITKYNEK